jgi:hypothetical protein
MSKFLIPRTAEELPVMSREDWKRSLGEDPLLVTRCPVNNGLIRRGDLAADLDKNFTAGQLREMLRERGLSIPGHKIAMMCSEQVHYNPLLLNFGSIQAI